MEEKLKTIPYVILLVLAYLFCIMLLYFTEDFPLDALRLPRLIAISTIILLTITVFKDWRSWKDKALDVHPRNLTMLLICLGYVALISVSGVIWSTMFFLCFTMLFLSWETEAKKKYLAAIIFSVTFSLILYGSFRYLLKIRFS